jgi:hypothetical protein
MKRTAIALLSAAGALALMTTSASAAVVCNDDGDCWRTKERYTYPPTAGIHIYGDDYAIDTHKYKWREARPGRGYWSGGVWTEF